MNLTMFEYFHVMKYINEYAEKVNIKSIVLTFKGSLKLRPILKSINVQLKVTLKNTQSLKN